MSICQVVWILCQKLKWGVLLLLIYLSQPPSPVNPTDFKYHLKWLPFFVLPFHANSLHFYETVLDQYAHAQICLYGGWGASPPKTPPGKFLPRLKHSASCSLSIHIYHYYIHFAQNTPIPEKDYHRQTDRQTDATPLNRYRYYAKLV